jgi:hypothetical protein
MPLSPAPRRTARGFWWELIRRSIDPWIRINQIKVVKPEAINAGARYRNAVVFQSAERLISIGTKRRPRHSLLRTAWLPAGLLAGLAVAFLLLPLVREKNRGASAVTSAAGQPAFARRGISPPLAGAAPTFAMPATLPAGSIDRDAAQTSVASSAAPISPAAGTAQPGPFPSAARASVPAAQYTDQASLSDLLVLARSAPGLQLRGELHADAGRPLGIEFQLYLSPGPLGGSVDGAVQIYEDPIRSKPFHVSGTWLNRTLVLREVDDTPRGSIPSPDGYSFVLELPTSTQSDEITGAWRQAKNRVGTLTLKRVPTAVADAKK